LCRKFFLQNLNLNHAPAYICLATFFRVPSFAVQCRVARWFGFRPKIPILVKFGGPCNKNVVIFNDHLEYFTDIWYIKYMAFWYSLWSFGIFLRCGMFGPRKIWQPWFNVSFLPYRLS
jgi:hypothetical protein